MRSQYCPWETMPYPETIDLAYAQRHSLLKKLLQRVVVAAQPPTELDWKSYKKARSFFDNHPVIKFAWQFLVVPKDRLVSSIPQFGPGSWARIYWYLVFPDRTLKYPTYGRARHDGVLMRGVSQHAPRSVRLSEALQEHLGIDVFNFLDRYFPSEPEPSLPLHEWTSNQLKLGLQSTTAKREAALEAMQQYENELASHDSRLGKIVAELESRK